jgi:murein L,D-transpeptidase YcbB/YkuD
MRNHHRVFMPRLTLLILSSFFSVTISLAASTPDFSTPDPTSIANLNYDVLQRTLSIYENAVSHPWASIAPDAALKPGKKNIAVLALRSRLRATADLSAENDTGLTLFDTQLTDAVKHFQFTHGLNADGVVGSGTLYELNIPPEQRLMQIRVNMNRWAKLAHELGNRYILVNIPAYRLELVDNGQRVLTMRAVVGKPERPTPEIISTVTRLVLNPFWNVPRRIAQRDIVPKVIDNPDYLNEIGMRIFDRQEVDATEIYPSEINWDQARDNGFPYHFRQDPGEQNALGLVKFEFQNSEDIYMHDTPAKNLFDRDKRAFSSGCIRLERPFDLADYLMDSDPKWNDEMVYDILNQGKTKYIKVAKPTKVIITYLTTWVDDEGNLQFRDDLYGIDGLNQAVY